MASEGLHEAAELLGDATIDRHRAITSIMEELAAVDWYDQRVDATGSEDLAAVLAHNRDEEKEHAAMTLEWLRRRDPVLDGHLRTYLFTEESIVGEEQGAEAGAPGAGDGSLGVGSLQETGRGGCMAQAGGKGVFHGHRGAGLGGVPDASPHEPVELGDKFGEYPRWVATAVARLRDAGVEGPYGVALGPRCYAGILETTEDGGDPIPERLPLILGGPVLDAPAADGAVVLPLPGAPFHPSPPQHPPACVVGALPPPLP